MLILRLKFILLYFILYVMTGSTAQMKHLLVEEVNLILKFNLNELFREIKLKAN